MYLFAVTYYNRPLSCINFMCQLFNCEMLNKGANVLVTVISLTLSSDIRPGDQSMNKYGLPVSAGLINTFTPRQNGRHFTDNTFKCIFLKENIRILMEISPNFVGNVPINNISSLAYIMAWRWPGLSEPMMVRLLTHICITRPQWVNTHCAELFYRLLKIYTHFQ